MRLVRKRIIALLAVIFSSMALALSVAVFFIYYYGPSGQYRLENVLLSPTVLENLSFSDKGYRNENLQFHFHQIEWAKKNQTTGAWSREAIPNAQYSQLYNQLESDVSIKNVSEAMINRFYYEPVTTLFIMVRANHLSGKGEGTVKVFQEVQFLVGDKVYRVQLHDDSAEETWAYFEHEDIEGLLQNLGIENDE